MSDRYRTDEDDDIIQDATVDCNIDGHVYYENFKVQFPKRLREPGHSYRCDLAPVCDYDGSIKFYRAIKGTIIDRRVQTIKVVQSRCVG